MRPVVLSGFMGTGKSTVGPLVARELGVPFTDTDGVIEAETGIDVAEIWQREGESAFRARERLLATRLLSDAAPGVIAFGGGTVTQRGVRHLALERATVVTLTASAEAIAARVGDARTRPNLDAPTPAGRGAGEQGARENRVVRIRELYTQRAEVYAESHAAVVTDDRTPEEIASEVVAIARREPLVMPLGLRTYPIDVARAVPATRLAATLSGLAPGHLVVVTDENVVRARGAALDEILSASRVPHTRVVLAAGEENKTLASVARVWDAALGARIDRSAVVLAFGGGVITDLAGFAASTLLRGLRVVQIPTTLLAMVDASVGGKTGFDHGAGKNLIGTFHQPSAVVVDLDHLATLPLRELRAGLAEIVKVAIATDAELLGQIERQPEALAAGDAEALLPIVRHAVLAKVRVVRDDERESGARALLNLGHTIGHAIEAHGDYKRYLHGEAVAVGTVAELRLGAALGLTPPAIVGRAISILARLGLPTEVDAQDLAAAWRFVGVDKKRAGADLRLPVVREVGVASVERVPLRDARLALGIPENSAAPPVAPGA